MYCGVIRNPFADPALVRQDMRRLEAHLTNPDVHYLPEARRQLQDLIQEGKALLRGS